MPAEEHWAVIVAAGSGTRLGKDAPKALVPLLGRPMFLYSVEAFLGPADFSGAVVVVPSPFQDRFVAAAASPEMRERLIFVEGGPERSDSVLRGLQALPADDEAVVLIHDAARPLVDAGLIERVVDCVLEHGNATPALPVNDTIKEGAEGRFVRTLERDSLQAVQTPQGFRKGEILGLLREFPGPHPDDAVPLELVGRTAFYVPGDRRNIKITYAEDVEVAEALLRMRAD